MKQTFNIHDTEPLLLLGVNDRHLQMLSESFDATLVARGGAIMIEGDERAVQNVSQVLSEMIISI
ncbi:MAG: hypothetical protein IID15_08540, partial [Candidatus Marinimicrobia bacterium]|nr:hypothetical protein [Candidatus Neomarinimicrobiota bacterium]